jgi:hypothetical protein
MSDGEREYIMEVLKEQGVRKKIRQAECHVVIQLMATRGGPPE